MELLIGLIAGLLLAALWRWFLDWRTHRRRRELAARSVAWWTTPTRVRR
jgi:predicted CDP-diglyceride synthetase/phosphatidate cytidylyltransferase